MSKVKVNGKSKSLTLKIGLLFLMSIFAFILVPGLLNIDVSQASGGNRRKARFCSQTARVAFDACLNEKMDDFWIAVGNCYNLSDADERAECLREAKVEKKEAKEECRDQREARLEVCDELGEAPYDPELDPEDFVDPATITAATANRYFPLVAGTVWNYETRDGAGNVVEEIKVEVTSDTKEIEYPAESGQIFICRVVRDVVTDPDSGEVIEDTRDWYAQDKDGNVWYMGEIAQNFEDGELVDIEGSWTAGKDFAKPGILMEADPIPADIYRQEFALGDAEDSAAVISRNEAVVDVPYGNWGVDDDVLQTKDFTPIEPDVLEYKYYAPGVGCVLEENPEAGERVELVSKTP